MPWFIFMNQKRKSAKRYKEFTTFNKCKIKMQFRSSHLKKTDRVSKNKQYFYWLKKYKISKNAIAKVLFDSQMFASVFSNWILHNFKRKTQIKLRIFVFGENSTLNCKWNHGNTNTCLEINALNDIGCQKSFFLRCWKPFATEWKKFKSKVIFCFFFLTINFLKEMC